MDKFQKVLTADRVNYIFFPTLPAGRLVVTCRFAMDTSFPMPTPGCLAQAGGGGFKPWPDQHSGS